MNTVTTFIRISTICALISCISLGCTRPTESSEASVDDWVIPDWMDASDPAIAERLEEELKELQAKVKVGRLDEEAYQYDLLKVPKRAVQRVREQKMRGLRTLLEDEGRLLKFSLLDLRDEIQGFIRAKGPHSLGGPEGALELKVLEKLAMDRLEVRIEIQMIEEAIASNPDSGDDSSTTRLQRDNGRLTQLNRHLAAMDAEFEVIDALARDKCANVVNFEHMLRKLSALEESQEDNRRALSRLRLLQMTPSEDEELLGKILSE
jgi:hypothetical protein